MRALVAVSGSVTFLEKTCGIAEVVERALHGIISPRKKNIAMSHLFAILRLDVNINFEKIKPLMSAIQDNFARTIWV